MQKKSIVTSLAVSLAAVASFGLVNAMPAMADAPSVSVHLDVSHAGDDVEADELEEAIVEYLEAHDVTVEDDGDVDLNIAIDLDEDGESFEVTFEWDTDADIEETEEYETGADGLTAAIVDSLDEFVDDIHDGNVDD